MVRVQRRKRPGRQRTGGFGDRRHPNLRRHGHVGSSAPAPDLVGFRPPSLNRRFAAVPVRFCLILFFVGFVKKACVSDNVVAVGVATGSVDFGGGTIVGSGLGEAFVVKLELPRLRGAQQRWQGKGGAGHGIAIRIRV